MFNRPHLVGFPGLWWLLALVCIVVLVVGLAWLIAAAVRGNRQRPPEQQQPWQSPYPGVTPVAPVQPAYPPAPMRPTPHEILRERLARGELTVEEFQRTMAALGPDPLAPQPPPPQVPPQP
jgi:hypothetical protein